ncbi:MAG: M3 family oligoendopeptidase [Gracilimonas sp.]|uniref:M3 family oligoendopeptidase n=1 Tax=Gracilimonas TaxID=649462 RepID=UPI001B20D261|nr:M3 family oligoendopeptidase [Gracilimonas sp.]MBO6587100.1 M3 family oligoendopeptidase [Gracilimonas sp.]MBO6614412.1 M3 family oligoendopeptidase [Gracilimonas sp.]
MSENSSKKKETGAESINWDLTDLYSSNEDPQLAKDKKQVVEQAEAFGEKYRGRVAELSPGEFKKMLDEYEEILDRSGKIGSFAYLQWSTDTTNTAYGKLVAESNELSSEVSQKLVFLDVEWMQVPDEEAQKMIESEELSKYKHYLESSRRYKEHVLEEGQEKIMSAKSVTGRSAWVRFFDETLGAAKFELDGEELSEQEVLSKLHESDRDLRIRAHKSLTDKFNDLSRQLTFVFNTILADKSTNDKLRKYDSWIDSRNLSNQTDKETVDALVESVTSKYELVQRYYKLKRDLLGLDEMKDYDRYAPIMENEATIDWNSAKEMVLDSYTNFHPEMGEITYKFFEKNWIDAAIKPGKRGGAYSAGTVPSAHPYVFMNFDGKIRDVQTLAHELGHGVHQYLSRQQGVLQSSTPLTTAETASVFGEMLVFQKLMKELDDPKEKLALLIGKIDDTIATVFRQISMNRFEHAMHTARREEGELTKERFSELWMEQQKALYGDSVTLTDEYGIWWSYIPHFLHTPGYVYAYAFGELLVLALYEEYTQRPEGFPERYMELLSAGGAEWPHDLVAKMGLDITQPDFWNKGLASFERMVEEAEEMAKELAN